MFDFAKQERKGRERAHIPCRPAKRPTKNWQGRRHSPVVAAWKEGGRPSELAREKRKGAREREGRGRASAARREGPGEAHKRSRKSPQTQVCFASLFFIRKINVLISQLYSWGQVGPSTFKLTNLIPQLLLLDQTYSCANAALLTNMKPTSHFYP